MIRHKLPNGNHFPISAAVEIPAGKTLVFLSGMVPPVADPKAPEGQHRRLRRHQDPNDRRT